MFIAHLRFSMTCRTAVADQHVTHKRVKSHVEQCRKHQESNGQHGLIPGPCDAAGHGRGGHNGQSQRRGKILLTPKILTAADAAATKAVGLKVRRSLVTAPATAIAANRRGGWNRCRNPAAAADWTLKDNVTAHVVQSSKNGGGSAYRTEVQSGKSRKIRKLLSTLHSGRPKSRSSSVADISPMKTRISTANRTPVADCVFRY